MLVYNSDPGWSYSDMNGFGPYLEPFFWFKAYWAACALLLATIAILFWVRGTELGVRHRLTLARARLHGPTARIAAVAIALMLVLGGFVFYNINVLNKYAGVTKLRGRRWSMSGGTGGSATRRSRLSPTRICGSRSIPTSPPSTCAARTYW